MGKKEQKREKNKVVSSCCTHLVAGQKYIINDAESGSKALVPVEIDVGYDAEVVQIDKGLIGTLGPGQKICDSLVFSVPCTDSGLKITWIIELKGTKNLQEVQDAIKQIVQSIRYLQDTATYPQAAKYLDKRDYVFVGVAGAPDKTLPILSNEEIKSLCKKLMSLSGKHKEVKNMFSLFCYIRPNKNCKKASKGGGKPPFDVICYSNTNGYIPFPNMLISLMESKS